MRLSSAPPLTPARLLAISGAVSLLFATGCNRTADTPSNLATAIDAYYKTHPSCVWKEEKKMPIEASASDASETVALNALAAEGLLDRRGNTYDVSKKGRSSWKDDPAAPSTGNFCYGRRTVDNIDSSTPTTADPGSTTKVVYRYNMSNVPKWAKATDVQSAFPDLRANLAGAQLGRATLTDSAKGWKVTDAPEGHISNSDSKLIE